MGCYHLLNSSLAIITDSEGRTPLHWAVDRGHLNVVGALVERNSDVNSKVKDQMLYSFLQVSLICDIDLNHTN